MMMQNSMEELYKQRVDRMYFQPCICSEGDLLWK
jgi:hypothetical protein